MLLHFAIAYFIYLNVNELNFLHQHGDSSSDSEDDAVKEDNGAKEDMNADIVQKEYEADKLTERLENAEREQKELFLILFQVSCLLGLAIKLLEKLLQLAILILFLQSGYSKNVALFLN